MQRSNRLALSFVIAVATMSVSSLALAEGLAPGGEFGGYFGLTPGVAGDLLFKNVAVQISPGVSLALGHTVRYHLMFGFAHLSNVNGFDIQPATLGVPIPVFDNGDMALAVEPLANLIEVEGYFNNGTLWFFESGMGVQAILNFESAFVSFAPLNFQFRYGALVTGGGGTASGSGFGMNMPIRIAGGLRF